MPKQRSPDRDRARDIYLRSSGSIPLSEIAALLNLSEGTVRGWKAKDAWETDLNRPRDMERSNKRTERSGKRSKSSDTKASDSDEDCPLIAQGQSGHTLEIIEHRPKANSPSPFARFGNTNAKGNKGGPGGPLHNKKGVSTHEYENFYYPDLTENEKEFFAHEEFFADKEFQLTTLIKAYTYREIKITNDIKELKNSKNNLMMDTIVKTEEIETDKPRPKSVTTIVRNTFDRCIKLEEALTRVQAQRQKAVSELHRLEMDHRRVLMDEIKLDLYQQKLLGRLDTDDVFTSNDLDDLEP